MNKNDNIHDNNNNNSVCFIIVKIPYKEQHNGFDENDRRIEFIIRP